MVMPLGISTWPDQRVPWTLRVTLRPCAIARPFCTMLPLAVMAQSSPGLSLARAHLESALHELCRLPEGKSSETGQGASARRAINSICRFRDRHVGLLRMFDGERGGCVRVLRPGRPWEGSPCRVFEAGVAGRDGSS